MPVQAVPPLGAHEDSQSNLEDMRPQGPNRVRNGLALILAGVFVGVVGLLAWTHHRNPAGDRVNEPVDPGQVGAAAPRVLATEPPATELPATARSDRTPVSDEPGRPAVPEAVLEGRVMERSTHRPVGGVRVVVLLKRNPLEDGYTQTAATGDDGRFRMLADAPCLAASIRVEAGPRTASVGRRLDLALRSGRTEALEVFVGVGARLVGHVVDLLGNPVGGASVEAWCKWPDSNLGPPDRTTIADAGGRFVLENVGERFFCTARAPGFVVWHLIRGELAEGQVAQGLTIVLSPERAVRGVVHDEEGRPVEGVSVCVGNRWAQTLTVTSTGIPGIHWGTPAGPRSVSDSDGRFIVESVPEGAVRMSAEAEGFLTWDGFLDPGPSDLVEVVLKRGASVEGHVSRFDGTPAGEARVILYAGKTQSRLTDEIGYFRFDAVPATSLPESGGSASSGTATSPGSSSSRAVTSSPVYLAVSARGCAVHVERVDVRADERNVVDVRLERELSIGGRVVDADGQAVPNARVTVQGARIADDTGVSWSGTPNTWEFLAGASEVSTNDEGQFLADRLYSGSFVVRAYLPGSDDMYVAKEVPSGTDDTVLVLDAGALRKVVLRGQVLAGDTGLPLPVFEVIPMIASPDGRQGRVHAVDDPEGRFEVAGLEPGPMELRIKAPGYEEWSSGVRELGTGDHDFEVFLRPWRN